MALKKLDRLYRSKEVSPNSEEATSARPRRKPRAERRTEMLASGRWLSWYDLLSIGMSIEEAIEHWLSIPERAADAANWNIDPSDQKLNVYQRFAAHAWAKGWNPIMETWDRKPGVYFGPAFDTDVGKRRKRVPTKPSEVWDTKRLPSAMWVELDGSLSEYNVAMTIGTVDCTCVLDMDIRDQDLIEQAHAIADDVFGQSPFVRVNTWPKRQLVFRMSAEDLKATPTLSFGVLTEDGKPDLIEEVRDGSPRMVVRNAIEFLSYKHNWTAYGRGKKGNAISWALGTLHPAVAGPEEAPLITRQQLKTFFERVNDEVRPIRQAGTTGSSPFGAPVNEVTAFERAHDQRIWKPRVSKGVWIVDESGTVIDGREPFAAHMAWAFCAANTTLLVNGEDAAAVKQAYIDYVTDHCQNGEIKGLPAHRECSPKFDAAREKWLHAAQVFAASGKYPVGMVPYRLLDDGRRPSGQHIAPGCRPADGSLDWLPATGGVVPELAGRSKISGIILRSKTREQIELDKKCRQLIEDTVDRQAIHDRVAAQIDAAYDAMLAEVLEREEGTTDNEAEPVFPLHILGGPTGSGKTTRGLRRIGAWCKQHPRKVGAADRGPIVIAMPTGDNIEEALRTAQRNGMTVPNPEMDIDQAKAELEALGVKVAIVRGKAYNQCQRLAEVEMLGKRGMSSARLCGARVPKGDELEVTYARKSGKKVEHEEVLCPYRAVGECQYWIQMDNAADADIILVPHSYLTTLGVPEVIKNPRAVFIDESITYRVLHQIRMPLSALGVPRDHPWLTKEEKAAEINPAELYHEFEEAREIAKQALMSGSCPAADLAKHPRGVEYVDAALKTCDRNHRNAKEVRPDLTADQVAELTARENGTNLSEETRFWRTVKESVQALVMDQFEPLPTPRAKGKKDMRLQVVHVIVDDNSIPFVRISWRSEPNWSTAPIMLLDASASPKIMAKVFSREIVRHDISAPLHVRTVAMVDSAFSNSSFIPREGASDDQIKLCKFNVVRARALINKVAVSYSYGMLLVGMSMAVRQVIFAGDWTPPPNVEVVHFGALRGLDFAKGYVAALSIGRSEQPIHIIDGYAAALSYDDDEPELPHDKLGTGVDDKGQPVFRTKRERIMQMRTGEDYGLEVPEMPSAWGKELEEQWREEEQRQFVGRLRPVYRMGDAPVWVCMTKCMPTGFIVDDVVALDDTLQDGAVWAMLKMSSGVLAPGLSDRLPAVQKQMGDLSFEDWLKAKLPTDAAFHSRMAQTLYKVTYLLPDGTRKIGRIAGWHTDPAAAFQALADAVGVVVSYVNVEPLMQERVVGARRKPDRLANELAAVREARHAEKVEQEEKGYVALVHALLPPEEGITVEALYARFKAGENIEDRLIGWLHSWRLDRDVVTREEVAVEWEEAKTTKTIDELYEMFGIAGRMAAE